MDRRSGRAGGATGIDCGGSRARDWVELRLCSVISVVVIDCVGLL